MVNMFKWFIYLQICGFFIISTILLCHFILAIFFKIKSKYIKKGKIGSFQIVGLKKSFFGESLRQIEIVFLIFYPFTFHISVVAVMFYRSYTQTFESSLNWQEAVKIYAGSLLTIIFCIIFLKSLKVKYGSFEQIFLMPADLSDCKYVSVSFPGSYRFSNNNIWYKLLGNYYIHILEQFPVTKLCRINVKNEPINFFGTMTNKYFEYYREKYWWYEDEFVWSREILSRKAAENFPEENSNFLKERDQVIESFGNHEKEKILELVGTNSLGSHPVSLWKLIFSEFTSVLNIIRIMTLLDALFYSFIVWPLCWSVITFYTITWSIIKARRNYIETEKLLTQHDWDVYRYLTGPCKPHSCSRTGSSFIFSRELFPGTVIFIDKAMRIPADLLLLNGNVVVDESCLTGEATPQCKTGETQLVPSEFSSACGRPSNSRHLYAGSKVLEVSSTGVALAMVTRTGSATLSGAFISCHSNAHPVYGFAEGLSPLLTSKSKDDFTSESILSLVSCCDINKNIRENWNFSPEPLWILCLIYGAFIALTDSYALSFEIGSIFFIVSTVIYVIPFWSTSSMSLYLNNSIEYLNREHILTTNPKKLNQLRLIDTICFDKTGTLTAPIFSISNVHIYPFRNNTRDHLMQLAMASCNNLIFEKAGSFQLAGNNSNYPSGSKLEQCLYNYSGFCGYKVFTFSSERLFIIPKCNRKAFLDRVIELESYFISNHETSFDIQQLDHVYPRNSLEYISAVCDAIEVTKRYPFDETLRSQSVAVKKYSIESEFSSELYCIHSTSMVFMKGAAEKIVELTTNSDDCNDETNFRDWSNDILKNQVAGSYILGYCYKVVSDQANSRNKTPSYQHLSSSFIPLGLAQLKSPIRSEAAFVVKLLSNGNFHCPIITGDNINSAIVVAKEVGIISNRFVSCYIDLDQNLVWEIEHSKRKIKFPLNNKNKIRFVSGIVPPKIVQDKFQIALSSDAFKLFIKIINLEIYAGCKPKTSDELNELTIFSKIISNTVIFARFTPELKSIAVELLERLGMTVLMVGDGPNDVIALQKANSGLLLTETIKYNGLVAPFISTIFPYGLHSVCRLIIESRGVVFALVSMYQHIVLLGIFFVTCKTFLLWQSQAMIPAMAWLFIDIFCTLLPLLLFSLSRPKEYQIENLNTAGNYPLYNINPSNSLPETYDSDCSDIKTKSLDNYGIDMNSDKHMLFAGNESPSMTNNEQIYNIKNYVGCHIFYTTSFLSLIISLLGFVVISNRLVHFVLPKHGIERCFKYNLTIPVYLWHVRQDNIEAASSWCYISFQLVNQVWPIWLRSSSLTPMKTNIILILWNITMNLFILFCIWMEPSRLGCILRINCDDQTSRSLPDNWIKLSSPFYGQYNNNIFPRSWRIELTFWCFFFFILNIIVSLLSKTMIFKFEGCEQNKASNLSKTTSTRTESSLNENIEM
ncbi:E1-E2 ATPase family [Cryptosporidium sp. chipmunk genotype I]|uniref:E1-E2 ATPase family n=1 Tax=Cryptosporidium sp. chipmunk genotype I TaxID=1280935 RepID=UPI003519F56D|nr:E1-E2 ATPase family [Cryptosporidium sp. chipmunk genotype I]